MGLAPALEHRFRPLSNGLVIPIFAFFSAGVAVDGIEGIKSAATDPVALGIVAGLLIGKPAGIFGASWLMDRFSPAVKDNDYTWTDMFGISFVAGIGFTVSLLVAELSFAIGSPHNDHAKAGILFGSMLAAVMGGIMLLTRNATYKKSGPTVWIRTSTTTDVAPQQERRAAAHSCIAGRSTRYLPGPLAGRLVGAGDLSGGGPAHLLIHHGQGPAPPGQLPCDSHVSDRGARLPFKHPHPAVVQSAVAGIAAGPSRSRGQVPAVPHDLADAVCPAVVPGCVDQQPPGMGVTGEAVPVPDLHCQPEAGQCGDPAQAPQPVDDLGELGLGGHLGNCLIQSVTAVRSGQNRLVLGIKSHPRGRGFQVLAGQVHRVLRISFHPVPKRPLQLPGAATTHRIPSAFNTRDDPKPMGRPRRSPPPARAAGGSRTECDCDLNQPGLE